MKANESKLIDLLSGKNKAFVIPVYQRKYSWNAKDNCAQLLKDLKNVSDKDKKTYFFSSIVFYDQNMGGYNKISVIDGQQRITTITILLKAIYDFVCINKQLNIYIDSRTNNEEEYISLQEIKDNYFYFDPYRSSSKLKLQLVDSDSNELNELFKKNPHSINGLYDYYIIHGKESLRSSSIIHQNYIFFRDEFDKMTFDEVVNLRKSIDKLNIVSVSLQTDDDPQLIFESLNSKSLPLKESDKIRNYILMEISDEEEQNNAYKEYWKNIEINSGDELDRLISIFLTLETNSYVNKDNMYYDFKEYRINGVKYGNKTAVEILEILLSYSIYLRNIYDVNYLANVDYMRGIRRLLKLKVNTILPLIIELLKAKDSNLIDDNDFNQIIVILESYIARRFICSYSAAPFNKIFAYMPKEINDNMNKNSLSYKASFIKAICKKNSNSEFPSDIKFRNKFYSFQLYNAKSEFRKYFFSKLENSISREYIDVDNLLRDNTLTIEHIMPQQLSAQWITDLGEDYKIIYEKYLHTPGNLTLSAYNSEYSNMSFTEKLNLNNIGFKYSKLNLNEYIKKQNKWTEKEILERMEIMCKKSIDIWPYPISEAESEEFSLLNPDTWDNVKITRLGKEAFDYILTNNIIGEEQIEAFKTKEYSKKMVGASYPVLADSQFSNMTTSKKHYNATPYIINGNKVYLSFEWFEEQREKLCSWLKLILNL